MAKEDRPPAPDLTATNDAAVQAWNLMGGALDWTALDLMVEMLGIDDVEGWIRALAQIRDDQQGRKEEKRRDDDQPQ